MDGPELVLAGGYQPPWITPIPPVGPPWIAATPTANQAYCVWFRVDAAVTVTTMKYVTGSPSGNVDLGIYEFNADASLLTRLGSTGSTAAAGSGVVQSIALTAAVRISPGVDYCLAFAADNGTITLSRIVPNPVIVTGPTIPAALSKASSFPLPTSIATPSASNYAPFLVAA
ncbi:MAG: hypothetical protein IT495_19690 [Gammaproteobacteria bacterium]|nr:hypothetical protein [Gammaproteobacteria bacterium]